jgi:hypothetical protein
MNSLRDLRDLCGYILQTLLVGVRSWVLTDLKVATLAPRCQCEMSWMLDSGSWIFAGLIARVVCF